MFRSLFTITMTITLTVTNTIVIAIAIIIIIITTITIITILSLYYNQAQSATITLTVTITIAIVIIITTITIITKLNLYYNQAQSRQHPKRGTAGTKLVLQSALLPLLSQKSRFRPIALGQSKIWIPDGEPARLPLASQNLDSGWGTANPPDHPLASKSRPNYPRPPKNLDSCMGNSPKTLPGIEPADFPGRAYKAICFSTGL